MNNRHIFFQIWYSKMPWYSWADYIQRGTLYDDLFSIRLSMRNNLVSVSGSSGQIFQKFQT